MSQKLVNLKRPKDGSPGSDRAMPAEPEEPKYPYGTQLRLETAELTKLGIGALPTVGKRFRIQALGYVDTVHESQSMENEGERCVTIQLTDVALEAAPST